MQIPKELPIPEIIAAAAASNLGILALMVVAIAVLGYAFFSKAKPAIRVGMFILMFAGTVAFGTALMRAQSEAKKDPTATKTRSNEPAPSTEPNPNPATAATPSVTPGQIEPRPPRPSPPKPTSEAISTPGPAAPSSLTVVLDKITMHRTPQSGTWLLCFRAIAGADTQQFHIPDREYSGDNVEIPLGLRLGNIAESSGVRLEAFLDDDEAKVCTPGAEDVMRVDFKPEGTGDRTFRRDEDWSYTLFWRSQ